MNRFGLSFHHFGLAVREREAAALYLDGLGYRPGPEVFDPLQNVNLALYHHDTMPMVEVIWAGPSQSPIDNLLKRRDGLIYHLCYVSESPEKSLQAMEAAGLRVLPAVEPRAAVLFGGLDVSFHHVASVGLIELIHGIPR